MCQSWLGEIKDSEFEALFGIMDVYGNNSVDFVEFVAFMGMISRNIDVEAVYDITSNPGYGSIKNNDKLRALA